MVLERTLSIVKPDAVRKNLVGKVVSRLEAGGLKVVAAKMVHLTENDAKRFYDVHKGRPFFQGLVSFMSSGPILVQVLEGDNAILKNREIMGATNPKEALPGTLRADFAASIDENVVHGSDAPETAREEIAFFFKPEEIFSRQA